MLSNQASRNTRPTSRFVLGAITVASATSWCGAAQAESSVTLYG
ncbi:porin, partial [Burkholderia contaminans]